MREPAGACRKDWESKELDAHQRICCFIVTYHRFAFNDLEHQREKMSFQYVIAFLLTIKVI